MQSLLNELTKRPISLVIANKYLKQIFLQDTKNQKRRLNGFAFANHKGGYQVSIPNGNAGNNMKVCLHPKSWTIIEGQASHCFDVFDSFWDFLAGLEINHSLAPSGNAIVLNSLDCCHQIITEAIVSTNRIDTVRLFLNTAEAGAQATRMLLRAFENLGVNVRSMDDLYINHKSLSSYWSNETAAKTGTI